MNPFVAAIVLLVAFFLMARIVEDFFIKALDNIAGWMKLTPSVSGASLMAFGTSAPEISTTMFAVFLVGTNPATGLGAVVGSAIFQILVVIGFATIIKTAYLDWKPIMRDGIFYTLSIIILILVLNDGTITSLESGAMVSMYAVYLVMLLSWSKYFPKEKKFDMSDTLEEGLEESSEDLEESKWGFVTTILSPIMRPIDYFVQLVPDVDKKKYQKYTIPVFLMSLFGIGFLSYWLVIAAESLAGGLGVPSSIIALTILAGGTSVPEVISSAVVSREGRGDMAISNAIGSNTFDILMSLGLPVFIYTLINGDLENIGTENINSSIFLLFATMLTVIALMVLSKFKLGKKFGVVLIVTYVFYVIAVYAGLLG